MAPIDGLDHVRSIQHSRVSASAKGKTRMQTLAHTRTEAIVEWSHEPIVERYARGTGTSREESLACFTAWKQFMAVSALRGAGNSVPSGPIDEMWHTALMFTKPYREFCDTRVGRFVDHNPQEHSNPEG
jgi:hypothetical protein